MAIVFLCRRRAVTPRFTRVKTLLPVSDPPSRPLSSPAVGQQASQPLASGRVYLHHLADVALRPCGLATAQMAYVALSAHDLAAACDVEAALGPFMGLQLRQTTAPWLPAVTARPWALWAAWARSARGSSS